eukprot:g3794.t1
MENMRISGCNGTSSVIMLSADCSLETTRGTITLNNLTLEENTMFGHAQLIEMNSSCSQLSITSSLFSRNLCTGTNCMSLGARNTLTNVQMVDNGWSNNESSDISIFLADAGSETILANVTSEGNQIRSFFVSGGTLNITDSHFTNNTRIRSSISVTRDDSIGGGVLYVNHSSVSITRTIFEYNYAFNGAGVFALSSNVSISDCIFRENDAGEGNGGALYMELSNATVQNTTIQSNNATEDCGGICATETSYIEASNVIIRYNLAKNAGGGIGISNDSSILCYSCMISNNTALNGAGMHVSSNNSILVAAQLQNSMFENNSASLYGGGIVFVDPTNRGIRCDNPNITCSQIILLNTSFVNNSANRSGSAIISTHANGVLIDCDYRGKRNQGFLDQTNFSSLEQLDPRQLCKKWIENSLVSDEYAGIVGTYGQEIKLTISLEDNDVRLVGNAQTGYVLEELSLGMQLPMMNLTVVDGFGIGPVLTSPQSFIARLSSSDDLFFGDYLVNISDGSGHFSEVAISPSHGMYRLQINFEHQNLETIYVIVIVRACRIGEEFILELRACQECDAISYNFNPSEVGGCTQCPITATCRGLYIVPKEGYWHKTPCHNTVKECLIEEACSYENRYGELMSFTNNLTDCNLNTTELDTYNEALCNEGYEGLLCGSCKKSFGLSARFLCLKCPSTILSLITITGIFIYLLAAASFTIKGCLPSTLRPRNDPSPSDQLSNAPGPSNRNEHLDVEMVKMLGEGHVAQVHSEQQERPNISQPQPETQAPTQQENEYELTKWRTTEIFKVGVFIDAHG